MSGRWGVLAAAAFGAALLAGGPGGCAVNPATGEKVFTGGISGAQEQAQGRKLHPQILRQFGPALENPALQRYVDSVGQLLARTAERRDLKYTFTVIDSDIANAFAVPGGYIYITSGLLALFDSEAELAAVLGHELGHIAALHYARGRGQAVLAQLGVLAAGILAREAAPGSGADRMIGELGGKAAFAYLRSFSRENEYESDDLGIRYLARAGYDTGAVARMLGKLRAHGRLEAELAGRSPDGIDEVTPHVVSGFGDAEFGTSIASAGDANGDGFGDVVFGGPDFEIGADRVGAVRVAYGEASLVAAAAPSSGGLF